MILAFRFFTHAVIILNFFLKARKESVFKCKCAAEKKKQENFVAVNFFWGMSRPKVQDCKNFEDNVIYLAETLENLEKCLESLPLTSKPVDDIEQSDDECFEDSDSSIVRDNSQIDYFRKIPAQDKMRRYASYNRLD